MSNTAERVNLIESQVLSHDWYRLKKITFDYLRDNDEWQRQPREVYDRGNGGAARRGYDLSGVPLATSAAPVTSKQMASPAGP